jgi:hypothetical protein
MPYKDPEKQKAAQRRYYLENKEKYAVAQKDRRGLLRKHVLQVKDGATCADCGISYPHYVMDFDHVRGTKSSNIHELVKYSTLEKLKEEIDKCDLVCANCHRHRTWMRSKNEKRKSRLCTNLAEPARLSTE